MNKTCRVVVSIVISQPGRMRRKQHIQGMGLLFPAKKNAPRNSRGASLGEDQRKLLSCGSTLLYGLQLLAILLRIAHDLPLRQAVHP